MAITLTIELTDEEQARILEIASVVSPGATPLQIKQWAEKQAKLGLRNAVVTQWNDYQYSKLEQDWPGEERLPVNEPQI